MQGKVSNIVFEGLKNYVYDLGFEIYDVDYSKKQNGMNLTIFIVRQDNKPVLIEDCELVHRKVDPILDEINPTGDSPYYLNISSLGLDWPIKTNRDFNRVINHEIIIKLYKPEFDKKEFIGNLIGFNDDFVDIYLKNEDKKISIDRKNIAICKENILI